MSARQERIRARPASSHRAARRLPSGAAPRLATVAALIAALLAGAVGAVPSLPASPGESPRASTPAPVPMLVLGAVDAAAEGRAVTGLPGTPLRFARASKLAVTPKLHGAWRPVDDGWLWRLTITAPGATDLNLGFDRFALPPGASLRLVADDPLAVGHEDGPFGRDDASQGELWTAPQPGDTVTIELVVPGADRSKVDLRLAHVGAGFRDVYGLRGGPGLAKQGECNIDVVCPEAHPWRDPVRAVAAYSINGVDACTGTLIMDAGGTFTPWFLTAHHCGVTADNDQTVVTIWNYESPTCGSLGGGARLETLSGASLRATRRDVDVTLLELDEAPPVAFDVHYSGWDRSDQAPTGSVAIHHPGVDEKAISFNDDPLTKTPNCIVFEDTGDTHWEVDDWELGTTEPGSSGSGLFDPVSRRLIGFLSGGLASCTVIDFDCYGRFAVAWSGGTHDGERLQPWLDPTGSGTRAVDGADPAPNVPLFANGFETGGTAL